MINGILGKKVGMTQVFTQEGDVTPITVIEVGPCTVVQKKTIKKDGYNAVQLGFFNKNPKKLNKPLAGHLKKHKLAAFKFLKEIRCDVEKVKEGEKIGVDIFKVGEKVKVTGTSKGRGFAGVMKRYGFGGAPASRGTHEAFRHGGSIGQCAYPGKVYKGKKMPGHMGNEKVTVKNIEIADVKKSENLLLLKGAVPGSNGGFLIIKKISA